MQLHICRNYKILIWGKRRHIFFLNFDVPEESLSCHISPEISKVAWMLHIQGHLNLSTKCVKCQYPQGVFQSPTEITARLKKSIFSMKSVICISRNSSAVKVLKSLDLFNSQPSLHLHTGCLPSWLSYFLIASYWKWVMTLLSFTSLIFSHDLPTSN